MKFYLIGAGVIARSHAAAIRKLQISEKIEMKVADPNSNALREFVSLFPEAAAYLDAESMLADEAGSDDIVIVCTPPFTHFDLASLALESGRHVLCEKPLVMNRQEANDLLKLAKKKNRLLGCCSDRFIGLSKTEKIKSLLDADALGEIYKVTFVSRGQRGRPGIEYQPESKWFLDRSKAGGGIVMDWGPYDFALLNDIFKPKSVEVSAAWLSRPETEIDPQNTIYDIEGHAGAMLKYDLGDKKIWVQYERASCTHGKPYSLFEIEGTKGSIEWSPFYESDRFVYRKDKDGEISSEEMDIMNESQLDFMDLPIYYFYQKVMGKPSPAITNEQAVFNFLCLQAVYDCAQSESVHKVSMNLESVQKMI